MSWAILLGTVLALSLALLAAVARRAEVRRTEVVVRDRRAALDAGDRQARLQHPVVDLSRCLGCGTCVAACPEEGVLEIAHGQAVVVNGARCVGHEACARECPVGAITVTLADLESRRDVPLLDPSLAATGVPGLHLAGELTAHALIRTAVEHGVRVARAVAANDTARRADEVREDVLDLCIVGAGPAGLACALEATRLGLRFVLLDQERVVGGTVARYPRRKLVLTQPVELPLHGMLRPTYEKEELVELWQALVREHAVPLRGGQVLRGVERRDDGSFVVRTDDDAFAARAVCLALGRRGTPRTLGVPGEDLPKVAYNLLDAAGHAGRSVLVVGGGDSAVEAALGLAEQPGSVVTLSYRKSAFTRIRARNGERIARAEAEGRVRILFGSELAEVRADEVVLSLHTDTGARTLRLPNDDVFVMAGGTPPFELLERAGVSFDPSLRPVAAPVGECGTGLVQALAAALVAAVACLLFATWNRGYYGLAMPLRPTHVDHELLRPGAGLGLALGVASLAFVIVNLVYLARRAGWLSLGSLRAWMTSHVATGVLAVLCAVLHAGMAPRATVGGDAFLALAVLLGTGAVGRYVYAWVPRAANGRELALDELRAELSRVPEVRSQEDAFERDVRAEVISLLDARRWKGSLAGRLLALCGVQLDLARARTRITRRARAQGVSPERVEVALTTARDAHRQALLAAHAEDLRAALASWRWVHRWVAALLVVLVVLHVGYALNYGGLLADEAPREVLE